MPIFHLALLHDWEVAQRAGSYTVSTRGRSLADVGFIHASRADQWTGVRDRFYADVTEPMVLLQIDPALLDVPVVEEAAEPGSDVTFPHIYGPLPVGAVVKAIPLPSSTAATSPAVPPVVPGPAATRPVGGPPAESFSRLYFREMFVNVALLCVVIAVGLLGAVVGHAVSDDGGRGIGGLAGIAVGIAAAVLLFRRRHGEP
ncbi:DUF952 domain-containing protein [Nocardioides carbamazepini]|uniref:DUF952 domain-containing protein n=1 Tax=Nocardioides carbamazepini TaxID=2854259 RepID=UPI002149C305|nr:DUF952 domain-containing protein [Nocardioides carbamazepini]MCR1781766.1 DUF952 domain-containing protein [Nocardioides carbamazepini]